MGALGLPFRMHELGGQPIEQLGIHGPFSLRAEIFEHTRESDAEELTPHTIDISTRSERIAGRDQPVREIEASRAAAIRLELAQKRGDGRLDDFVGLIHPIGARQNRVMRGRVASVRTTRGMEASSRLRSARKWAKRVCGMELRSRKFEEIQHRVLLRGRRASFSCLARTLAIGALV